MIVRSMLTVIVFIYPSRSAREGLAIVGCQSGMTGFGEAESERGKCSIGARYQRWICCSAVARLYFECLIALLRTRNAVLAECPGGLGLGGSIDDSLVQLIGGQTH